MPVGETMVDSVALQQYREAEKTHFLGSKGSLKRYAWDLSDRLGDSVTFQVVIGRMKEAIRRVTALDDASLDTAMRSLVDGVSDGIDEAALMNLAGLFRDYRIKTTGYPHQDVEKAKTQYLEQLSQIEDEGKQVAA